MSDPHAQAIGAAVLVATGIAAALLQGLRLADWWMRRR